MIDQLAGKFAIFIRQRNEGIVSEAVMKFALIIIINVVSIILFVLALGFFTNTFKASALALFGFAILRFFSGGLHLKSSVNCVFMSVLLISIVIFLPLHKQYEIWMNIISLLLVVAFAPSHIENYIRFKKRHVPFLRIAAISIVCLNFYLDSSILTKCFLIQSLTLIEFRRKGE
jgi:accessory gene regulator B